MLKSIVYCVLSFASAKERYQRKAARETFLARKVSRDSSKDRRGIFAFEAKMLHAHENLHNAPPTERRGLFGCSLPANYRHGRLCVVVILFFPPTEGSVDRGDLVGGRKINWGLAGSLIGSVASVFVTIYL